MQVERLDDTLRVELDPQEAGILRELLKEMRLLLEADIPPGDDVLERLFPRAHEDDGEEHAYQELVRDELHDAKVAALRTVSEALGTEGGFEGALTADEADSWLRLVNDLRLAIGTRLEVDEEKMERPYDPTDPEAPALSVLHWLGWLQGSMLEELTG